MDPATLTFEQALELLRIPRAVGTDPETGEEVVAHNGQASARTSRRGTDTRSLASEDQILTVTLPEAQALFAQPKQRRGRRPRPRRCASWGPTRPPTCPSSSRTAASVPT